MPRTEDAQHRAGARVALAAVAALCPAPAAVEDRWYVVLVLALFVVMLLGCAAVLPSPAHRTVARLAAEAARGLRWIGFTGVVLCVAHVVGDAWKGPPTPPVFSVDKVNGFLLFLVFLSGVWTVKMSMLTERGSPPAAAEEGELDGGEVDAMLP